MLAFKMTPKVAEEFWKRVIEQKADTPLDREKILIQMANEGLMMSVSATSRTKEQYVTDLSKEFKVLDATELTEGLE